MARTLTRTRKNWERFARADAMSAILIPQPGAPAWDEQAFFASGRAYVQWLLDTVLAPRGLPAERGRALDFGCGIGRLTAALGQSFGHVVGVDIAQEMLQRARQIHADRGNLTFVHNTTDELSTLETASFDLVLSVIVLQHIPVESIRSYIHEFIRVVRPGGVVVFQLPVESIIVDRGFLWDAANEIRRVLYRPRRVLEWRRRMRALLGFEPRMEMRGMPLGEVHTLIAACGGTLVETREDRAGGDEVRSLLYVVTR